MTASMSATYTENDIHKVYSRLHADLQMIAESTGIWTQGYVDKLVYDLTFLAIAGYLSRVGVYLLSLDGTLMQAEVYVNSGDASSWTAQRPSCRWPRVPGARLRLVWSETTAYKLLTAQERLELDGKLKLLWVDGAAPDISTLTQTEERTYVSNGYGLRRTSYR